MKSDSNRLIQTLAGLLVAILCSSLAVAQTVSNEPSDLLEDDVEAELLTSIDEYKQALLGLGGVYNQVTTELNLSLAEVYMEAEQYGLAMESFSEALQSVRISNGLFSAEQLPILELFADGAMVAGGWEEVESSLFLAYSIAQNHYEINDPRFLEIATRYANWKVSAQQNRFLPVRLDNPIEESLKIYGQLIDNLDSREEANTELLIGLLETKGLAHYYSALYLDEAELEEFSGVGSEVISHRVCTVRPRVVNGQVTYITVCNDQLMPNPDYFSSRNKARSQQMQANLRDMRESYQCIVDILQQKSEPNPMEVVSAMLNLGDINLLVSDVDEANKIYATAYEFLEGENVSLSLRQQLFHQPQKALAGVLALFNSEDPVEQPAATGTVTFSVSSAGDLANARISGTEADLEDANRSMIVNKLQASFYRPAIVDGLTVDSELSIPAADL
jgi:tetratricopeptide (TPR) repeat protein